MRNSGNNQKKWIANAYHHDSRIPLKQKQNCAANEGKLYDVALSSLYWNREIETINEFLSSGREMGFCRFELNHQVPLEFFELIDFNKYRIATLHNPCPAITHMKQLDANDFLLTSLVESKRQKGLDVLKHTIETAQQHDARSVVIHAGWITGDNSMDQRLRYLFSKGEQSSPEYGQLITRIISDRLVRAKPHMDALMKSIKEIISFTSGSGLMLGIENLLYFYEMPNFDEMQQLLDEFKEPWFGWQLDVGHVIVQENLGLICFDDWLKQFSERMIGVHFHDVKGLQDHLPPGTGDVDFASMAALIPPQAQLTFEISNGGQKNDIIAGLKLLEQNRCITTLK